MVDNEKGQTALHKAAAYKRRTICCLLIAAGASLLIQVGSKNILTNFTIFLHFLLF